MGKDQETLASPEWFAALNELSEVSVQTRGAHVRYRKDSPRLSSTAAGSRVQQALDKESEAGEFCKVYEDEKCEEAYGFEQIDFPSKLSEIDHESLEADDYENVEKIRLFELEDENDNDDDHQDVGIWTPLKEPLPTSRFKVAERPQDFVKKTFETNTQMKNITTADTESQTVHTALMEMRSPTYSRSGVHIATQTDLVSLQKDVIATQAKIQIATQTEADQTMAACGAKSRNGREQNLCLRPAARAAERLLNTLQEERSVAIGHTLTLSSLVTLVFVTCLAYSLWSLCLTTLNEKAHGVEAQAWRHTH